MIFWRHMINVNKICEILILEYKDSKCSLNFRNDFELIVSARLSAQCKDSQVNKVTPLLFKRFPDYVSLSKANLCEIEEIVKPCGLFKIKSKNLKDMCKILNEKFNSRIPFGIENLQKLPGIGRKTANLIMSEIFNVTSIIVDTHVKRITRRIGFHNEKNILKIEYILKGVFEKSIWSRICHCLVFHGRKICTSKNPKCNLCCINAYCNRNLV